MALVCACLLVFFTWFYFAYLLILFVVLVPICLLAFLWPWSYMFFIPFHDFDSCSFVGLIVALVCVHLLVLFCGFNYVCLSIGRICHFVLLLSIGLVCGFGSTLCVSFICGLGSCLFVSPFHGLGSYSFIGPIHGLTCSPIVCYSFVNFLKKSFMLWMG
jgi:hypothetical protein